MTEVDTFLVKKINNFSRSILTVDETMVYHADVNQHQFEPDQELPSTSSDPNYDKAREILEDVQR